MKQLLFFMLLLCFLSTKAQVTISGRITDKKNKALYGVSIVLKNTYDGATTDSLGKYTFTTVEKGEQLLEASITGFNSVSQKITIGSSPVLQDIALKEQVTELKAVIISAGAFEASDKNKGAVLNSLDIVTTPSANGDVTSAFKQEGIKTTPCGNAGSTAVKEIIN